VSIDGGNTYVNGGSSGLVTFNGPGSFTSITVADVRNQYGGEFAWVEVDGKLLVNSNATPPNFPTIASTVRANPSAGFSIVSYTGSGTSNDSVGHGLNAAPELIITKNRDGAYSWRVLTTAIDGSLDRLFLDATNAKADQSGVDVPTSSVFSVGSNLDHNKSGDDIIAYCFAPVEGYSAFGSYTGNGQHNNDLAPFIYTGFRPAFIMFKRTDSAGAWEMYDSTRSPYNPYKLALVANTSGAEYNVGAYPADMLSNGFKIRHSGGNVNANAGTYIYAAFAEHPFKTARAR
jgi:hypothetical protein